MQNLPLPPTNNGEPISPASEPPPKVETPKAPQVAIDTLKNPEPTSSSPKLSKKVSPFEGWVDTFVGKVHKIIDDFRHRNVAAEDRVTGNQIKQQIHEIKTALKEAREEGRQETQAEKHFEDIYPSQETIYSHATSLAKIKNQLILAESIIQALRQRNEKVQQLSKTYSVYEDLPLYIRGIEAEFKYLSDRTEVGERLLKMEQAMQDYSQSKTWENFKSIKETRAQLAQTLQRVLKDSPDKEVQKLIRKPRLTARESYILVKRAYPSLRGYTERLLDFTVEINNERIENLHQQRKDLKSAIAAYHKQAEKVATLERYLYDKKSIGSLFGAFISLPNS